MDNQTTLFKNKNAGRHLIAPGIILSFLLVALTVFVIVETCNKIKARDYIGREISTKNTITVSGSAEKYAKPDLALITFSVINEAKTVTEAMDENTAKINSVIDMIKENGILGKDIKTTAFKINPLYEYVKTTYYPPYYPQGKRMLTGYEITQSLRIKIRALDKIGLVIEEAAAKGANMVGDLQFIIEDQDELKDQVRAEAIAEAKIKALELATQLGVELSRISNFSEGGPYYGWDRDMEMVGMLAEEGSLQVEVGENRITADVVITYEIE